MFLLLLLNEHYYKTTSCCRKLKAVYHKYAIMFKSKIDSTYKVAMSTYEGDRKINLVCIKCSIIFFHCYQKRHSHIVIVNVNVLLYETCEIFWCYGISETTKKNNVTKC